MIGIHVILVVVGATLVVSDYQLIQPPPPYVQSREFFDHAKYYVQHNLPLKTPNNRNEIGKRMSAFGIITGVLTDLVQAADNSSKYQPYQVLQKSVPASWKNYLPIAEKTQNTLADLEIKIKTITDLMDNICGTQSISDCNSAVKIQVDKSPLIYGESAHLLLLLGPVSRIVVENQSKVNTLTGTRGEIPYLLHNVDSNDMKNFVEMLLEVHKHAHKMQFRRFLSL